MRVLIQRVTEASVTVDGKCLSTIGKGLLILIGVTHADTEADSDYLVNKCLNLRIFEDDGGKMNLSLLDVSGDALLVSQFTLYGDCIKGRRPGFDAAAKPEFANRLYLDFAERFRKLCKGNVGTGIFGADMKVRLLNDGPVTFMIESRTK